MGGAPGRGRRPLRRGRHVVRRVVRRLPTDVSFDGALDSAIDVAIDVTGRSVQVAGFGLLDRFSHDRDLEEEARLGLKMTAAAVLSWYLATLSGEPRPIFAALVPFAAMSMDPFGALSFSFARILGVFAGVGIAIGVLHAGLPLTAQIAVAVVAGTFAGMPLRAGGSANVEAAVSALFLVVLGGTGAVGHLGVTRIQETAIGAGVSLLVSTLLWPPDPARELRIRLARLRQALAADLAAVAGDLATGSGATEARLDDLRANSLDAVRIALDLEKAQRALRANPLRRRDAPLVASLARRVRIAARLYRHARAVARDVADAEPGLRGSPDGAVLAAVTRDLAEAGDLALRGEDVAPAAGRARAALDAYDPPPGDAFVLAAQLRQMLADLPGPGA